MTNHTFSNHPTITLLCSLQEPVALLGGAGALLGWDQETYMPTRAAEARAKQLGYVSVLMHERMIANEMHEALKAAEDFVHTNPATDADKGLVREARRTYDLATKLPTAFVQECSEHDSRAMESWKQARSTNTFSIWAEDFAKTVALCKQKAEYVGYTDSPYSALLNEYEPGTSVDEVKNIFTALKLFIEPALRTVVARPKVDTSILHRTYPIAQQQKFNEHMAACLGYNFEAGRLDVSTHPFSTNIGSKYDCRITTRYKEDNIWYAIGSTIHEIGHALYEQGIADSLEYTSIGGGVSLGIHESQSRLYENMIGKSVAFWQYMYPKLVEHFPTVLALEEQDAFVAAINAVEPGYIRTEADELSYNLHIILRFEIEVALMNGEISVHDVPEVWNQKMQQLFGFTPPTIAQGCLQDVHWSMGSLGYFPTYTLGNVYSAKLWQAMQAQHPDLSAQIAQGNVQLPLTWLRSNVHEHGAVYTPKELCMRATGETLTTHALEGYFSKKFGV
jgi:carboxypeptidase Taq